MVKGVYKYKENGLFGFGGIEEQLKFDYSLLIEIDKKNKVAVYEYDGHTYKQIGIKDLPLGASGDADYITTFKIAELEKNIMLKKPFDLKDLLNFLLIIATLFLLILVYFLAQNVGTTAKTLYQPVNKTIALTQKICTLEYNQSVREFQLDNATLAYLERVTGATPLTGTT